MSLASSAAFGNTLRNNEQDQIRILLQKIEQGLDEVKCRSIDTLHSKMKKKLVSVRDLTEYYSDLPGYVMQFINEYQTIAEQDIIQKAIHILALFSQDDNGSDLLNQYGALEFFARYQENVQGNTRLEQITKELLANLVQERGHGRTQNFNATTGSTARFQQTQQTMGLTQTYNLENKENVFGNSRGSEIRGVTDKYQTKDFGDTARSSHYGGYDGNHQGGYEESFRASARNGFRDSVNVNGDTLRATVKPTQNTTNLMGGATMMVTKPKQTYHVESDELIKLKARKEDFFPVVYAPLSEADERYLFDVTVRLKYDNKVVKKILSEQHITQLIRDFPIEALFLQGELLQELLMLVRKSGEDVQYLLTEVYIELLEKMVQTIEMYENPYNGNQKEAKQSDEFLFSDEKNYIKNSYPTLKPVSAEFMEDPAFKKSQETFHFNYFLLLDGIVDATVDLIDNTYFADNINKIWQFVITLLRKYKYKKVELVAEASKDYLRRFVKKLERLDSENLEKRIEYSYLYNILYAMFRMFSIEEYQQMEGYKVEGAIDLLYKGLYRFVFTEKEVDSILSYSQYLAPERHAKYEKVMTLLGSVIRLKHKELDLMKIDVRDIGRDLKELQEIIDLLDRVLMGVPYANMNNFIGLYAEVLLYAQVIEGGFGDQIYSKCRKMLLNLLNVPNVTIRTTLLESLLVNLLTDSQVIYRREGFPKKSLAFQSLLDREIATEILFAGLESEQTINSVAKIFSSFLNIAMADNLNPARIQHFTNISTMIHCLTSESDPEATGTGPTASKGKYECLRPISEAIYKALPEALLKSLLTDLFSKDRKRRVLALKFLADPLFLKRLHGGSGKQDKLVSEYSEVDNKLRTSKREDDFIKNRGEKDPLEGFLDASSKFFVYKDVADSLEGDYGDNIPDIIMTIEDLMKIASDPAIEYRHRLSSIEQIGEMLRGFLKAVGKPEQLYKKEILVTVERVATLAVNNLIDYCKDRFKEKDSGYIGRILGLTNRIIGTSGLPGDLIWSFVGPLYDLNSEFMRANGIEIISLLVGLLEQRNDTARYHALQALNYLALGFRLSKDNLEDDWKPKMGAMSLKPLQEKFFVLGEFDFVDYVSKHKNFWSFLPLHEDASFFVDCHVVNAQRLTDPQFSVQDQVLDEKCERFCNQIREQSGMRQSKLGGGQRAENDVLLNCAENWAKTVSTMEFYLPTKLLEIDVFGMLTKIYGSCLTMASMKAENSGVERISGLLNKLLKSESLIKEVGSSEPLLDNIVEFLEFVASNVLGPLYDIQFENAREKMDVVLSALSIINRFLSFAYKSKQIKLKHILAKRVVKQSLIDLLHELSTFFNNNEALFLGIGKLAKNLLKFPEIYLVLNLKPLLGNLFDFMFQCSSVENFKSKSLQRWFLRFFLSYSLWEEDSTHAAATRNLSQSLSRLSATSREIVSRSSCLGWLLKLSEDRETEIRVYAWNLMCNLVNKSVLNDYQSSVETALITLYAPNESFGVVAQAVNYINKTLDLYMNEGLEDFGERGTARSVQFEGEMNRRELEGEDNRQQIDKNELLRKLYRQNIISRLKTMLDSFRCPPVYNSSLIALLRNTCVLNPSKAMPVLNQLEFWDLLVELINPKVFQKRGNGKKMSEWGAASIEVVMLVNNVMQFLIFAMSYDRQVGEYLIYCTQLVKLVIKWLRLTTTFQEKTWYRENPGNSFLIDSCSATLIQVLNLGLFLNEDKTIVMVNKLYEEKIERDSKESRYNIYLLLSKLFSATKNDILILATFRLISNLLPKWQKGSGLLELRDTNGECLSESLILNLFTHYKLNDMVMQDGQINQDDYMEAKNTMTACTCTLLSTSNPAKLSFIYSGFLSYCIKNMEKSTETLLLEDMDTSRMSTTKRTTARGTHRDPNASMMSMNASRMSFIPGPQTQTPGYEDIKSYLKILKYFFAEATTGDLRQKELYAKLEDQMSMIFDCITKSWRILSRKVDLFQEVARVLTNFGSNKSINSLCYTKLTHADAKSPILIDVTNTINKFESADKQLLKISFEFLRDMAHGKEVRLFLQRNKTIENCVLKLNKLWNGRKEWTLQNPLIIHIIELFLSLSFWKDSRDRILSDGSLLEELVDLTSKTQMKGRFVEKIWLLISNLAYDKATKNFFLKYEKIFSAALAILNLDEKSLRLKWISTQFFVNILHKCNAAIAVVKKEHIQDQFFYLKSEMERELDKLTFTNALKEENVEKIAVTKKLLENLSKVTLYVRQV